MNILILQVSNHKFHDFPHFSIPKVIFHDFPNLENFYFKFHDFPDFSSICMNPEFRNHHYVRKCFFSQCVTFIRVGIAIVLLSRAKRLSPMPVFFLRLRLRVTDIWNKLPNHVVQTESINSLKRRPGFKASLHHKPDIYKS